MTVIKRGLDVPISGEPEQRIEPGPRVTRVGLVGDDYIGMKPTMLVAEGDSVLLGQPLMEDKKNPGVLFTAPAALHRALFRRGVKRLLVEVSSRLAAAGLVVLSLTLTGAVLLVADVVLGRTAGITVGACVLAFCAVMWALLPLGIRRFRTGGRTAGRPPGPSAGGR